MTLKRIGAGARMSKGVIHNGTVYLSGLVGDNTAGQPVSVQTQEVLDQIDGFLAEAGTDKSKIIRAFVWLTDMDTWGEMNEVWDAWVKPGETPTRAAIHSPALALPGLYVEIMVEAAI